MDWTEKHRPSSLKEIVGNGPSVKKLLDWALSWQQGIPAKRAVILSGPPGTGKTSAALALAKDMDWAVIELNASDARNAEAIKRVASAGALHQTFAQDGSFHRVGEESGRKLIILDEADNLYERLSGENAAGGGTNLGDKGGKVQIVQTIRDTKQPIILIVNDLYELTKGSGSSLKTLAETIKWTRVNVRSIPKALAGVAAKEGIRVDLPVLEAIAAKAEGDLRAAVRDLESICMGRTEVTVAALDSIGQRDTTANMFDVVRHILKGRDMAEVRREARDVDGTPEDMVLWIDENMPKEYVHPEDLVAGYEMLSRADVFLGRTRSTQNYRLWAYAGDLSTIGVMAVKQHPGPRGFAPFGFPQWLMKMSRSRGLRQTKDKLALHLGQETHQSKRKARMEQVEPFTVIFAQDPEFQVYQSHLMDLSDEEIALLIGGKAKDKRVKEIREAVAKLAEEEGPVVREFGFSAPAKRAEANLFEAAKPKDSPETADSGLDEGADDPADDAAELDEEAGNKASGRDVEAHDEAAQPDAAADAAQAASKRAEKQRKEGGQQRLF